MKRLIIIFLIQSFIISNINIQNIFAYEDKGVVREAGQNLAVSSQIAEVAAVGPQLSDGHDDVEDGLSDEFNVSGPDNLAALLAEADGLDLDSSELLDFSEPGGLADVEVILAKAAEQDEASKKSIEQLLGELGIGLTNTTQARDAFERDAISLREQRDMLQEKNAGIQRELDKEKEKLDHLEEQQSLPQNRLAQAELEQEKEVLQQNIGKLTANLTENQQEMAQLRSDFDRAKTSLADITREQETLKLALNLEKEKSQAIEEQKKEASERYERNRGTWQVTLEARGKELEQVIASRRQAVSQAQAIMQQDLDLVTEDRDRLKKEQGTKQLKIDRVREELQRVNA